MNSRVITAIAAAAVAAVLLAGCSGGDSTPTETSSGPSGTLRVAWAALPTTWAPGSTSQPGYMRVPYETLVVVGDDGFTIEPWLATSWEQTDTDLTLTLRDDVTFHDGTPFNAEAVKANLEYVRDNPGSYSGPFQVISGVDAVDDVTVKIHLTAPTPSLLTTLTGRGGFMASPAALADGSIIAAPVGTGPWAYSKTDSIEETKATFTLFDDYWGTMPGFANVELYGIADNNAAAAALISGELDVTGTKPDQLPTLEAAANVETMEFPAVRNNIVFLDRGPGGVFEDADLRKAVCYAANNNDVLSAYPDALSIEEQHFVEGEYGYNPDIKGYPYDVDDAKAAYKAAGSPDLTAVFPAMAINKLQIEIYVGNINKTLGTSMTVQELPQAQWRSEWQTGKYPIGLGDNPQRTPYDWYTTWFAQNAGSNPAHVESAALKAAAAKAIAAGTTPEAEGLWENVMKIIIDDEALACTYTVLSQILAWNPDTVTGVAQPSEVWEPSLVNYRDLKPVTAD